MCIRDSHHVVLGGWRRVQDLPIHVHHECVPLLPHGPTLGGLEHTGTVDGHVSIGIAQQREHFLRRRRDLPLHLKSLRIHSRHASVASLRTPSMHSLGVGGRQPDR